MEYSDDWCFFTPIGSKTLGVSRPDMHECQLVSVNNAQGWVFFVKISSLHYMKTCELEDYFTSDRLPGVIEFTSHITHVNCDKIGKSIAVCCGSELHILSFEHAIKGAKQENTIVYEAPIRKIDWAKDRISVLCENKHLEILQNNSKVGEKDEIQAFTFMTYEKAVLYTQESITIVTVPDLNSITQIDLTISTIGIFTFQDKILTYGLQGEAITLKFFTKELKEITEITSYESLPMSKPPSLDCDLTELPLVGYFEYLPSRDTILCASTCSVSVDVIMNESEYQIVNFEENTSGVCKVGWEGGSECVLRGFSLITNYGQPSTPYGHTTKDTTYDIPQPPLVLCFGSNGKLILSRFIDLRRDFLGDDACRAINQNNEVDEEVKINFPRNNERGLETPKKVETTSNPLIAKLGEGDKSQGVSKDLTQISSLNLGKGSGIEKGSSEGAFKLGPAMGPEKNIEPQPGKSSFFVAGTGSKPEAVNLSGPLISGGGFFANIKPGEAIKPVSNPFNPQASLVTAQDLLAKPQVSPFAAVDPFKKPQDSLNIASDSVIKPIISPFSAVDPFKKSQDPQPATPASLLKPSETSGAPSKPQDLLQNPKSLLNLSTQNSLLSNPSSLAPGSLTQDSSLQKSLFSIPENQTGSKLGLQGTISKPNIDEKPATISSNKISEMDGLMQMLIRDLKVSISSIESQAPSNSNKVLESKASLFKEKLGRLADNYLKNIDTANALCDNLDEIRLGIEYLSQAQESIKIHSSGIENIDVHLIKAFEDNNKALRLLAIYIENGLDMAIKGYKRTREQLGLVETKQPNNNWKKTRTYCPPATFEKHLSDKESCEFVKMKIEELKNLGNVLNSKANALSKIMRKTQQKIYNLSMEDTEEDTVIQTKSHFIDPNEYKNLFKNFSKDKGKRSAGK